MAGLPWIKVWTRVTGHPKVQRLEKELGIKDALGVVVRLWAWTADYAPDGEIPETEGITAAKFARADATRKPPAIVLEALLSVGLLDRVPAGLRVHDWQDMQTVHVEAEEKRKRLAAERQSRYRERHADASRNPSRNGDVTQASVTETERETEKERETEATVTVLSSQPEADGLAGEEMGPALFLFRSQLAERLELPKALSIGKDPARVVAFFKSQIAAVGDECVLNDCVQVAKKSTSGTPSTLSWFVGWLGRLPMQKPEVTA